MKHAYDVPHKKYTTHFHNRISSSVWLIIVGVMTILFFYQTIGKGAQIACESPQVKMGFLLGAVYRLFFVMFFLLIALMLYGTYNFTELQITKEGLIYKNLFYTIIAEWHEIQEIHRPFYRKWRIVFYDQDHDEWLRLSQSILRSHIKPLSWLIKLSRLSKRIPISEFSWNWRSSELGSWIFTKAPRLREKIMINRIPYYEE
jgi:hypothetical protein